MPFREGEVYRCPDPECACELTVTRTPHPGAGGDLAPTCSCGKAMVKV